MDTILRGSRLVGRALRLRCPECGGRGLFASWFRMRASCPTCALPLDRGERGYQVGSYMLNIIAAELLFMAVFLGVLVATWPTPPWTLLQYGGAALMVITPVVLYPFTKTVFLAADLMVRPASTPNLGEDHRGHPRTLLAAALVVLSTGAMDAQGLPAVRAINPITASRSALGFEGLAPAMPGWRWGLTVDHASIIESEALPSERFLFDGEVTRAELTVQRGLGQRAFATLRVPVERAGDGFLDGFVDWWHDLFGLDEFVNDTRPNGVYDYRLREPDGTQRSWEAGATALGDVRIGAGVRHGARWQTVVTAALPTSRRPDGFRRGVVGLALTTAAGRHLVRDRLQWEGSAGLGFTPATGVLAGRQRTWFAMASSGLRWRVVGQQSIYANAVFHSSAYRDTELSMLGGNDLTLDYGFLLRTGRGPEILLGMTEDLFPQGPAVDFSFRLGARW